jgi:hypothetical protein
VGFEREGYLLVGVGGWNCVWLGESKSDGAVNSVGHLAKILSFVVLEF